MARERLDLLYYRAPVIIQNIAVTVKGLMLENIRKRGIYNEYKKKIITRSGWAADDFHEYQLEQCRALIKYALQHVPYYQRVYGDLGISADKITRTEDLQHLPILSRATAKKYAKELLSNEYATSKRVAVHTTGTTGSPLRIETNNLFRQKNYAFFNGYLKSIGLDSSAKHIILGGRVIVPQEITKPPFWRYSYFQKSLLMSSYHLSDSYLNSYIDEIESFSPEYVESYPSSIYAIATYMLKIGRRLNCKAIVTSAETLSTEQREIIEQAFNTTVYDQYGCAEMCVFVAQCSHGNYHVRSDYGVLEIVDEEGNLVRKGHPGRVVCTGFINRVMPLIRYSIGDIAVYSDEGYCECGLKTPIIKEIQGRIDDVLLTRDGRAVGRLSPILKGFAIQESQYVQHNIGEVDLFIVPESGFSRDKDVKRVIDAVQMRFGHDGKINVHLVKQIERGQGGKQKSVISHVKRP
jgi:phenylacetate-CoA ligase